jgi:hypothetical protein
VVGGAAVVTGGDADCVNIGVPSCGKNNERLRKQQSKCRDWARACEGLFLPSLGDDSQPCDAGGPPVGTCTLLFLPFQP